MLIGFVVVIYLFRPLLYCFYAGWERETERQRQRRGEREDGREKGRERDSVCVGEREREIKALLYAIGFCAFLCPILPDITAMVELALKANMLSIDVLTPH